MKKLLLILVIFILMGCDYTNIDEEKKNDYITYRDMCLNIDNSTMDLDIPFDINIYLDRINDEEISYRAIIDNTTEDIRGIKAIITHDYFTEDIFPSIGILDDTMDLNHDDEDKKGIVLVGYINTDEDISTLDITFKLLIEYVDSLGEKKFIYYKTTNNS